MRTPVRHRVVWLAVALLAGCSSGRERAAVTGKVYCDDQPLAFGSVSFQPAYGQPATAIIQSDGSFALHTRGEGAGAVVGPNKVRITCYESQGPAAASGGGETPLGRLLIPEHYTHYETSGLTVDVQPGKNPPVEFRLKSAP